jgi:hypothetical protein
MAPNVRMDETNNGDLLLRSEGHDEQAKAN